MLGKCLHTLSKSSYISHLYFRLLGIKLDLQRILVLQRAPGSNTATAYN